MNTGHLNYHEYEYRKDPLIMSMNSKRKAIFNSTHMNTALFITLSGRNAATRRALAKKRIARFLSTYDF